MSQLLKSMEKVRAQGVQLEILGISELFDRFERETQDTVEKMTGSRPKAYRDYRDLLALGTVDAVVIASPDHWHARHTLDALKAGKHVYCEKPMTHTIDEAFAVVDAWRSSGRVMQVGVQSTSLPILNRIRELIDEGQLGKVLQYQTEYFRNSSVGQTRFHKLTEDMTPKAIDWRRWLGVDEGLSADIPFDRAVFRHWRCYWPFGGGMLTDLFVHRLTAILKATGLRFPGRVVGGGGIYLEYDDRDTPDVTTLTIDYREGVQGLVTATMFAEATRIPQLIRGHFGSFVFGNGEYFKSVDYVPERPQVTLDSKLKPETIAADFQGETVAMHLRNFFEAVIAGKPELCNNTPDLGAAAVVTIEMGKNSYRHDKVYYFDPESARSVRRRRFLVPAMGGDVQAHATPHHVPGWRAGDYGSKLQPPEYMKLSGPWIDGRPPESKL